MSSERDTLVDEVTNHPERRRRMFYPPHRYYRVPFLKVSRLGKCTDCARRRRAGFRKFP
jgi:hypothetical protein